MFTRFSWIEKSSTTDSSCAEDFLVLACSTITEAVSKALAAWAMARALRPEESTRSGLTPAANKRRQTLALLRLAANINGVKPALSRASRSSPRRICSRTAVSTPATTAIFRSRFKGAVDISIRKLASGELKFQLLFPPQNHHNQK